MIEPQYRSASKRLRPFARSAGVKARGCSRLLQRVLTDLAADLPFAKAMDKLVEHYGIVIGESTIRKVTLSHAQAIHRGSGGFAQGLPEKVAAAQTFIVQTDGTMVPTVRSASVGDSDARARPCSGKKPKSAWLTGSRARQYAARVWRHAAGRCGPGWAAVARLLPKRAGFGVGHRVHGLGDGAPQESPPRSSSASAAKAATCWTSTMCATTSARRLRRSRRSPARSRRG